MSQEPGNVNSQFSVWFRFNKQLLNVWCVRRGVRDDSRCWNTEVEEGLCEPGPEDTNTTRHRPDSERPQSGGESETGSNRGTTLGPYDSDNECKVRKEKGVILSGESSGRKK